MSSQNTGIATTTVTRRPSVVARSAITNAERDDADDDVGHEMGEGPPRRRMPPRIEDTAEHAVTLTTPRRPEPWSDQASAW